MTSKVNARGYWDYFQEVLHFTVILNEIMLIIKENPHLNSKKAHYFHFCFSKKDLTPGLLKYIEESDTFLKYSYICSTFFEELLTQIGHESLKADIRAYSKRVGQTFSFVVSWKIIQTNIFGSIITSLGMPSSSYKK